MISQVFVGDVFVCAGQSTKMELPMREVTVCYPRNLNRVDVKVFIYKVMENPEFQETLQEHREEPADRGRNLEEASAMSYFLGKYLYGKEKFSIWNFESEPWGNPGRGMD